MEREQKCELCARSAVKTCELCGSPVCTEHSREYGCDVCNGGDRRLE